MGLRFPCPNCARPVRVNYLQVGEIAQCKSCGDDAPVPINAEIVDKVDTSIPPPKNVTAGASVVSSADGWAPDMASSATRALVILVSSLAGLWLGTSVGVKSPVSLELFLIIILGLPLWGWFPPIWLASFSSLYAWYVPSPDGTPSRIRVLACFVAWAAAAWLLARGLGAS